MTGGEPRRITRHQRQLVADRLTPVEVYRRLAGLSSRRFLLESVTGGDQVSRYSILGAAPHQVLRLHPDRLELEGGAEDGRRITTDPFGALRRIVSSYRGDRGELPFTGGFVGYFGFDTVRQVERLPDRPPDPLGLPVAWLGRFDEAVVFDHVRGRVTVVASEIDGEVSARQARQALERLCDLLVTGGTGGATPMPEMMPPPVEARSPSLDGPAFRQAVEQAKRHIEAGDIFQVVLARRWRLAAEGLSPLALYRAVRMVNPSPYMVLLESRRAALVGASPEMLVRKTGDRLETRPIAGTRPRGGNGAEDRRLAEELAADEKERAEHLMLVDLGRNDLGRVARPGTVQVPTFMEIERYSHVMHLVSSVEARITPGKSALDALLACFPAGTVSGAPKLRAIEIIDALEPEARGPYAGAVGYLSFSGDLDTCITIRTLVACGGEVSVTAGAGIVADSRPEAEEAETESKAAALMAAVGLARELES